MSTHSHTPGHERSWLQSLIRCLSLSKLLLLHALSIHPLVLDLCLQHLYQGNPLAELDPLDLPRLKLMLLGLQSIPCQEHQKLCWL